MKNYEHWASPEAMKDMVDGWSDEMRKEVHLYLIQRKATDRALALREQYERKITRERERNA